MKSILILLMLASVTFAADKERRPKAQAAFTLRLVEASSAAGAANDAAESIPAELKSMLRFRSYGLLDSGYIRGKEEESMELALAGSLLGRIRFSVEGGTLNVDVIIRGPKPQTGDAPTLLKTETTAKNGETIVLGASRMQQGTKALIVLVTAKLL